MGEMAADPTLPSKTFSDRLSRIDRRRWFWVTLVAAVLVYSQFQFWKQPSVGDRANWDYFAQVLARGGVPYRDVVNIKTPLSAYIGAAAVLAGPRLGLRDIFAIRITFILLAALTAAFAFLVALECFDDLRLALIVAAAMLTFDTFARFNSGGVQPKTPMVLFGLLTLWATMKSRPFLAGVFGMLSALSWQPGLLFAGAAFLGASRYLTNWRDKQALKVFLGAALPLAVMLSYFWMTGALRDFYLWNVHYDLMVFAPRELRPIGGFFERLGKMLSAPYRHTRWLFYLSIAGVLIGVWRLTPRGGVLANAPRHAVIVAPLVYFLFCVIDIQGPVDLIPFIPFVAIFAAVALTFALDRSLNLAARISPRLSRPAPAAWLTAGIILLLSWQAVTFAKQFERVFPTLNDQQPVVDEIVAQLQPGDKIFVHGRTEVLVLSGLSNANKHFFLDRGNDTYLDQVEPGGFVGWFERLKAERPKIIALDRFEDMRHDVDLQQWADTDYVPHFTRIFVYYVRKDDGQPGGAAL